MNEETFVFDNSGFNPANNQSGFFQDIGTGLGDWVEGWGAGNKATAEYNAAVVEQKRAQTEQQTRLVQAGVKIAVLFALVISAVLLIKAFRK